MKRSLLIVISIVVGCASATPPLNVCPDPTPVYTDDDVGAASSPCGQACAHLRELGCPEGDPSPSSATSCYVVCRRAGGMLDTACVIGARDRTALGRCGVRCVR